MRICGGDCEVLRRCTLKGSIATAWHAKTSFQRPLGPHHFFQLSRPQTLIFLVTPTRADHHYQSLV